MSSRGRKYERTPLHEREVDIIRSLKKNLSLPVTQIALGVGRSKKVVYTALDPKWAPQKRGRPDALTPQDVRRLVRELKKMLKEANGKKEITLGMLQRRAKCKASLRCMRKHLHQAGIRFRRPRTKCLLSKEDVKERFRFAKKYRLKSTSWWLKHLQLHIDLKSFPVYANAKARDHAARREVRGHYRKRGEGLEEWYVTQPKDQKFNTGHKPCRIAAGVGNGRVCLWEEIKGNWTGAKAATLYAGPVKEALRKTYPKKRSFALLEDNDPTGFKSKIAIKAKKANGIRVFEIPRRSPDLNVCDYALWKQVTRRMRLQEKKFRASKRETRAEYVERLRKTAKGLSRAFVTRAIGSMRKRCQRLYAAKGRHFEEGGL